MDLKPPFWPEHYTALLELLGPEEFERVVCPIDLAWVQSPEQSLTATRRVIT